MRVQFILNKDERAEIIGSEPNKEIKLIETVDNGWYDGCHMVYDIMECEVSIIRNLVMKSEGEWFYAEEVMKSKDVVTGEDMYTVSAWTPLSLYTESPQNTKKLYYDYPTQVKFWEINDDEKQVNYGIAYKEEIICACCGLSIDLSDVEILDEYRFWIDFSDEIKE